MKIFAVGMNYIQHNKELEGTLYKPEKPVIFTKADSALLKDHKPFFIPDWSERVDYETELVVRICRLGKSIPQRFAHRYYDAVTVGIDFTARDWQQQAREKGHPWEICKGFDGSAVIGGWVEIEKFRDIQAIHFHLDINGKTVQEGCTSDMLYKVDEWKGGWKSARFWNSIVSNNEKSNTESMVVMLLSDSRSTTILQLDCTAGQGRFCITRCHLCHSPLRQLC